jgi:hypothetical protein
MPVTIEPPQPTSAAPESETEAGVIEEARRRQRRRRTAGATLAAGGAAVAIMAALLIGGGGGSTAGAPAEPSPKGPQKLTLVHGRAFLGGRPALMGVTLSLEAGNVGVCVRVVDAGTCNGPLPSAADPVYGEGGIFSPEEKVGATGQIDALFTGPGVAAVRVAHLGTFKAQPASGLPPGAKQVVFYRPPGSRGTVLPPGQGPGLLQDFERARRGPALTETLLDAAGRAIPVTSSRSFMLPSSYWQGTQRPPAAGRCAMTSSFPGARAEWGQAATVIAPDRAITVPGWLPCLHTWFAAGGSSYETALLLNAKSPGAPPAPLWDAKPLAGHPGIVEIPPVEREDRLPPLSSGEASRILALDTPKVGRTRAEQILRESERRTFWSVLVPPTIARRVGPAWLLVRDGDSLTQRIAFLQSLHVTKIALPHRNH